MIETVVIVGLGLMGGSMAKAIHARTDCKVYGWNRTRSVAEKAVAEGTLDGVADDAALAAADLVIVGLYPQSTIDWMTEYLPRLHPGCLVVDMVGVKRAVVEQATPLALANGVHFIGGHPMAGREFSGYAYATADLFENASMILVQTESSPLWAVDEVDGFFSRLGFGRVVRCSAEQHDNMIAYTSQLCHVVSSAFIKSPEALKHNGYSAGSYKDLTRVAWLNPQMWAELFLENRDNVLFELDYYIDSLKQYQQAIRDKDMDKLVQLLDEGKKRKEEVDG